MQRETVGHTILVAFVLCVVCSVMVSAAAVGLRAQQEANKRREIRKNILLAAGLIDDPRTPPATIDRFAERIHPHLIDLRTGTEVDPEALPAELKVRRIDEYDQRAALRSPALSVALTPDRAIHGINRRENYAVVYTVTAGNGEELIVLPVYGNGLWSTMYGFVALSADAGTIRGLTFYEHGETPGLGGEIDNPAWKAQWAGKRPFDEERKVIVQVTKPGRATSDSQADGISGATITSQGVEALLRFWLGPDGFGPWLEKVRASDAAPPVALRSGQAGRLEGGSRG